MKKTLLLHAMLFGMVCSLFASDLSEHDRQLMNLPELKKGEKYFPLNLDREWPAKPGEASICLWKDDKYAACSITIDDNCATEHDWWFEQAQKYGFQLTWFVITDLIDKKNVAFNGKWSDWQRVVDKGHAVESHTTNHRHDAKDLPVITPDEMDAMYRESLETINAHLKGYRATCLAYPWGQSHPDVARKYYIASRGVVGTINNANQINYMNTNVGGFGKAYSDVLLTGRTEEEKRKFLNRADQCNRRGWVTPLSHQVRVGKTDAERDASEKRMQAYLEEMGAHTNDIWFGSFPACAKYGQSRDTAELTSTLRGDKIIITLRDKMCDELFDEPLTIKVRLPNDWTNVVAMQAGIARETKMVEHDGARFALVNSVPDRGDTIVTQRGGLLDKQ